MLYLANQLLIDIQVVSSLGLSQISISRYTPEYVFGHMHSYKTRSEIEGAQSMHSSPSHPNLYAH